MQCEGMAKNAVLPCGACRVRLFCHAGSSRTLFSCLPFELLNLPGGGVGFADFFGEEHVPGEAITMGVATILKVGILWVSTPPPGQHVQHAMHALNVQYVQQTHCPAYR